MIPKEMSVITAQNRLRNAKPEAQSAFSSRYYTSARGVTSKTWQKWQHVLIDVGTVYSLCDSTQMSMFLHKHADTHPPGGSEEHLRGREREGRPSRDPTQNRTRVSTDSPRNSAGRDFRGVSGGSDPSTRRCFGLVVPRAGGGAGVCTEQMEDQADVQLKCERVNWPVRCVHHVTRSP